jgi:hypothetical protein
MSLKHLLFLFMAFCLLSVTNTYGQIAKKLNELNVSGTFIASGGSSAYFLSCDYGRFLTNTMEIGANLDIISSGNAETYFGMFFSKHFPRNLNSTMIPYVGCKINYATEYDYVELGLYGGMRLFITRGGALSVEPFYLFGTEGGSAGGVFMGISIFF